MESLKRMAEMNAAGVEIAAALHIACGARVRSRAKRRHSSGIEIEAKTSRGIDLQHDQQMSQEGG